MLSRIFFDCNIAENSQNAKQELNDSNIVEDLVKMLSRN